MTVIEATSPGDAWCKVSRYLLENGERVGNLTEEQNVVNVITALPVESILITFSI